jgi:alkylhydroperoxidase family enzyme
VASRGAPDAEYEALRPRRQFAPLKIVNLSAAIGMINLWKRLIVGVRGQYTASTREGA